MVNKVFIQTEGRWQIKCSFRPRSVVNKVFIQTQGMWSIRCSFRHRECGQLDHHSDTGSVECNVFILTEGM